MEKSLIIEFLGLPGAGKTTIRDATLALLPQGSHHIAVPTLGSLRENLKIVKNEKGHRFSRFMPTLTKNIKGTFSLFSFLCRCGFLSVERMAIFLKTTRLLQSYDLFIYANDRIRKVALLDQGLGQAIVSIALDPHNKLPIFLNNQQISRDLLNTRTDGLIWVDCSLETAFSRIRSRSNGGSRFDLWSDETLIKNLPITAKYLEDVAKAARSINIPVLRIESHHSVEDNCTRVTKWMNLLFSSNRI